MIEFKIDNTYKLKEDYTEITLNDMIKISKLNIGDFSSDFAEDYSISDIINILTILSDAPKNVLEKTDPYHLYVLFDFVKTNIINLYKWELNDIQPMVIVQYKHKGKVYNFPEYLTLGEETIYAHKEKSKYIVEANNLLRYIAKEKLSGIEKMKYVCALCMKEDPDEEFSDKTISKRSEELSDLPMYIVLQVFFSVVFYITKYMKDTLFFLTTKEVKENKIYTILGYIQLLLKGLLVMLNKLKSYLYGNLLKFYHFLHKKIKTKK